MEKTLREAAAALLDAVSIQLYGGREFQCIGTYYLDDLRAALDREADRPDAERMVSDAVVEGTIVVCDGKIIVPRRCGNTPERDTGGTRCD